MSEKSESTQPFGLLLYTDTRRNARGGRKPIGSGAYLIFPNLAIVTDFVNTGRANSTKALTEEDLVSSHEIAIGPDDQYHVSIGTPDEASGEVNVIVRRHGSGMEAELGAAVLSIIQQMTSVEAA